MNLFHRSKQGVQLTLAGERFLASSLSLIDAWERAATSARNTNLKAEGRLKLGCHPSVARYTLPAFLGPLMTENSGLEVHLTHDLSRHISEKVISWELDFGIVVNPPHHPDLVIKEICQDTVSLWAKKGCAESDILICDPDLLQVQSIMSKLKKRKTPFKRTIHSSNLEVIATLVASGCGVGILPERVMRSNENDEVTKVLDSPFFKDRICLIYRAGTQESLAAKKFIKAVSSGLY